MKNRFLTSKDYARLYEKARRILDREISKPSDEWDEGLIEELEETMLYCAERKKVLYSEEKEKRRSQPSFGFRKVAVVVIAILTVLALSATIAQAAGFRVWSAIVHWDANYLRVDYSANPSDNPEDDSAGTVKEPIEEEDAITTDFDSFDDLISYVGDRVLLPVGAENVRLVFASLTEDEEVAVLHSEYLYNSNSIVIDTVTSKTLGLDTLSHSQADFSNYENVNSQSINGIECLFGEQSGRIYCSFAYEESVYQIICYAEKDVAIEFVQSMLKGV